MHTFGRLFIGAAAIAVLAACESRTTGNEGNFEFSYPADDDVFDFNKPIAVGAFLDITVEDAGTNAPVTLSAAEADDAALTIVDFSDDVVTVQGSSEGNVLLTVTGASAGGEEEKDSVNLTVRVPEVHSLRHTCGEDGATAYLAGQQAWVPFDFEMANGQDVIGYGYYPVTIAGDLALDPRHMGSQLMRFDVGAAGTGVITSDIDGSTLELVAVDASAIDGVEDPTAFVLEDIDVGDRNPFFVRPTVGGRTVCQSQAGMTVSSDTPDTCAVRAIGGLAGETADAGNEGGWFEVEGLAEGTCTYTVTYTASGASGQFSYPIEP